MASPWGSVPDRRLTGPGGRWLGAPKCSHSCGLLYPPLQLLSMTPTRPCPSIPPTPPQHRHPAPRAAANRKKPRLSSHADELELIRPSIYRNVARQLNISLQSETVVTDAFLAVAAQIFSADGRPQVRGQHRPRPPLSLACGHALQLWPLPEGCLLHAAAGEMSCWLGQRMPPGPPTPEALGPRKHRPPPPPSQEDPRSPASKLEALP
nr:bcl-2-related ovarian killer protein isoform X2 [Vicugna pacos]